jgi:hypothetical protein
MLQWLKNRISKGKAPETINKQVNNNNMSGAKKAVYVICGNNEEDKYDFMSNLIKGCGIEHKDVDIIEMESPAEGSALPVVVVTDCNDIKHVAEEVEKHQKAENRLLTIITTNNNRLTVQSWITVHHKSAPEICYVELERVPAV